MITLKLVGTDKQIANDIHKGIATAINQLVAKNRAKIEGRLRRSVRFWISSSPAMQSLTQRGVPQSLHSQFGLRRSGNGAVEAIVDSIVASLRITIPKIDKRLRGTIEFSFQPSDFSNLLGLEEGHQITEKGTDLHWLDWLLTKGDSVIVIGYSYSTDDRGRSGLGTMKKGGSFRVNPSYSGTPNNNFITKALNIREKEVVKILGDILNG